jgi:hypothetical protein
MDNEKQLNLTLSFSGGLPLGLDAEDCISKGLWLQSESLVDKAGRDHIRRVSPQRSHFERPIRRRPLSC